MSQLLSKKIIAWYQKHKRSLPWRTHRNAKDRDYKVLISEFMLQQTKVSTVIPYFNKFYKKFPNINSLAKARITSVLKLWEGLGYYRRARNLHLTSKILNKDFDSSLPADINQLKNLPGIGDYTASAIMAIAKNKSFIGIDGNVKRVLSRIFAIQQNKDFIKNIEKKIITMKVSKNCSDSLAKARITSVLKQWEGLGYYRRARNLHLTSKILNKDFDSSLPADINQLKNLPGIGDYTASAIMAIAKNKSFIGIDGNAKRVLSRIFAIQQNKDFIKNIEKKIITMKVNKNCSELMQGIMEIGALLCRPKKPDCQKCPIQKYCKFSFRPNAEIIPSRKIKEKYFYAFFIEKKNQILFSYNKSFNFLKEMINLPLVEIEKNQSLTKITKTLFDKFEIKNTLLKKINYNISNFKMIITIVYLKNNLKFNNQNFFWIDKKKINKKILSVLTKKLIEASN